MLTNVRYSSEQVADILSVSKSTIYKWEKNKKLIPTIDPVTGINFTIKIIYLHLNKHKKCLAAIGVMNLR